MEMSNDKIEAKVLPQIQDDALLHTKSQVYNL
jgi:hypothetical protein